MRRFTFSIALLMFCSNVFSQGIFTWEIFPYPTTGYDNVIPDDRNVVYQFSTSNAGDNCQLAYKVPAKLNAYIPATFSSGSALVSFNWDVSPQISQGTLTFKLTGCSNSNANGEYSRTFDVLNKPRTISGPSELGCNEFYTYTTPAVPKATSYEWALAGFTGTSTSNSITVQSDGTTGSGSIAVRAKNGAADTYLFSKSVIRKTADTPTITSGGSGVVCSGQTRTITVNSTGASSYNWSVSGSANIVSGQGTNTLTYSSGGGDGSISVNGINGCGSSTTLGAGGIWGGKPTANVNVQGVAPYGAVQVEAPFITGTSSYNWYRDGSFLQSTSSNNAILPAGSCGIYHYIQVGLTNVCGSSTLSNGIEGGYTWYCGSYRASVYPNPASDFIHVEFEDIKDEYSLPETIKLYSENSTFEIKRVDVKEQYLKNKLINGNKVEMRVAELPKGTYYLHIIPKNNSKEGVEAVRVVLK